MPERDHIIEELNVKLGMLAKKYHEARTQVETLEQTEQMLREQNALLQKTIRDIKSAKVISLRNQDIKDTHATITRLINEIDKCIALLSV